MKTLLLIILLVIAFFAVNDESAHLNDVESQMAEVYQG